jgi:CO dehydrogenase nickel-insertion accessory protein CooC1
MAPALVIRSVRVVANKVRPGNLEALRRQLAEKALSADIALGYSEELALRDLEGRPIFDYVDPEFETGMRAVLRSL